MLARGCDRDPMPSVTALNEIRCTVCHYEREPVLITQKQYREYHKQKKVKRAVIDNAQEQEYLARLIAGGN